MCPAARREPARPGACSLASSLHGQGRRQADPTPLVLVSFSTVTEQRMPQHLQRTLDALAELPVRVVATTGAIVDPAELRVPGNAHAVAFAAHGPLMQRAALVVTHASSAAMDLEAMLLSRRCELDSPGAGLTGTS
jgi:UDP:flavonoid glycosyltransferase YjiC (YdhE family)